MQTVTAGTLPMTMIYPIIKTIVKKGLPIEPYYQLTKFDWQRLQHSDERIQSEELVQLIEAAAHYTKDEYFGLSQGQLLEFADLGILGYVLSHSNTIGDALATYERYYRFLLSSSAISLIEEKDQLIIRFIANRQQKLSKHCLDEMVVGLFRLLKGLTLAPVVLKQVSFSYEQPQELSPYIDAFHTKPRFRESHTELVFDKGILGYEVLYADHRKLQLFEALAQQTIQRLMDGKPLTDKVVEWIYRCMPNYFPSLKQTAEAFHMSERSLQQKLAEEGQSLIQISNEVKKELAITYLKKHECSISEIAYILHFSEPSSFQHAFKRWTGVTPGQYRSQLRNQHKLSPPLEA